jgi:hypothetical protein
MILTAENYYSVEANREYLSVSQYKDFCGTIGRVACEEQALAKLNEEWEQEKTTSLMIGSYVDAYFEGTLDIFKEQNPTIFTKQGNLKSEYRKAEDIIGRIERDALFMRFMSGEKQKIFECELFGSKWKVKLDSYIPHKAIVDLKIMKSLTEAHYVRDFGNMDFVRYWGYDIQAAVYQEVVRICTGEKLPFYIAAASKEKEPDINVIQVPQVWMNERLAEVETNISKILMLKNKEIDPLRCEVCDWCKHTKVLKFPIWPDELLGEV